MIVIGRCFQEARPRITVLAEEREGSEWVEPILLDRSDTLREEDSIKACRTPSTPKSIFQVDLPSRSSKSI
jgi:hypothetical protein